MSTKKSKNAASVAETTKNTTTKAEKRSAIKQTVIKNQSPVSKTLKDSAVIETSKRKPKNEDLSKISIPSSTAKVLLADSPTKSKKSEKKPSVKAQDKEVQTLKPMEDEEMPDKVVVNLKGWIAEKRKVEEKLKLEEEKIAKVNKTKKSQDSSAPSEAKQRM